MTAWTTGSVLSLAPATGRVRVTFGDGHVDLFPLIGWAVIVTCGADGRDFADDGIQETSLQPVFLMPEGSTTLHELRAEYYGAKTEVIVPGTVEWERTS